MQIGAAKPTPPPTAASAAIKPDQLILVRMREQADLSTESQLPRGPERRVAVWDDLVDTAQRTQEPARKVLDELTAQGLVASARSIPVANALAVTVKPGAQNAVADALRGVNEIGSVLLNGGVTRMNTERAPVAAPPEVASASASGIEWGVEKIGAPEAWGNGFTGKGVTIGIVDSGLDTKHEAIASKYRGTNASGPATHDYNWVDTGGYTTGKFSPEPLDDSHGHGTHVAGTTAGGTDTKKIGVAPDAKLIAARMVFADSIDSTISALDALQFMLAPTKVDGSAPDPTKGADVINNSWGAGEWESRESQGAFDALKAAGILLVNAAGNEGPGAGTVSAPGAYPGHISVAATDARDGVAGFSSAGPSKFDPKGVLPNVAAPGVNVFSSVPGGRYERMNGTSMAAPHVTGAVALMLQAKPDASYDEIVQALQSTATDAATPGPDTRVGYGRINVNAAIEALTGSAKA